MKLLRVAGATINQTPLDFSGNAGRVRAVLRAARSEGVELLVLPELVLSGYGCEDAFFSPWTAESCMRSLMALLPETADLTVAIGLPILWGGGLYNAVAMAQDGRLLGINAKRVLAREGVHYEPRWFRPWPMGVATEVAIGDCHVPFGDLRYQLGSLGVALEICEEAWDAVPAAANHAPGAQIVLNPSASHFALGKYARREHLVANSSRAMNVVYVYTNLLGLEAGRLIYDGGVLIAAGGEIIGRGPRFGFADHVLVWQDVNPELAGVGKLKATPVRAREIPVDMTKAPLGPVVLGGDPRRFGERGAPRTRAAAFSTPLRAASSAGEVARSAEAEFLAAEVLGLFDYLRKSTSKGFVVSLSGGCDSTCCAVLVAHMVAAALAELGVSGFYERLGLVDEHESSGLGPGDWRRIVPKLLLTVYQATANSGAVTRAAAAAVAQALGAEHHEVMVQDLVKDYTAAAAAVVGRPLTWAEDDLALQNIQARVRAPLAWLLANLKGFLLLTTSNRSEAAVGYATMDGDTAGGLAPLGGIDKQFLRHWLTWAARDCPLGCGAIGALEAVVSQAPTAELRPPQHAQTDEADLMPYRILERIERYFVRDRMAPEDIVASLHFDEPELGLSQRQLYVERFIKLWSRNQWKRDRLAPSFHIDEISLDPKTFCRFPILSLIGPLKA